MDGSPVSVKGSPVRLRLRRPVTSRSQADIVRPNHVETPHIS